jgi:hypothetical protein
MRATGARAVVTLAAPPSGGGDEEDEDDDPTPIGGKIQAKAAGPHRPGVVGAEPPLRRQQALEFRA